MYLSSVGDLREKDWGEIAKRYLPADKRNWDSKDKTTGWATALYDSPEFDPCHPKYPPSTSLVNST